MMSFGNPIISSLLSKSLTLTASNAALSRYYPSGPTTGGAKYLPGRAGSTWYYFLPGHFWARLRTGINHYRLVRPWNNFALDFRFLDIILTNNYNFHVLHKF